jgi:hypothetical protein
MSKEDLQQLIGQLPDTFSLEELLDRIILLSKIEIGLEQSKKNEVLSTEEVQKRLGKWLS